MKLGLLFQRLVHLHRNTQGSVDLDTALKHTAAAHDSDCRAYKAECSGWQTELSHKHLTSSITEIAENNRMAMRHAISWLSAAR
jgi:hypothetical protein